MKQGYTYEALTRPDSIRVLRLEPGIRDEPLRGTLITEHGFEESYDALSYVWGIPTRNHAIPKPEGSIPITSNLHIALQRIRLTDTARYIWADAVCINQDDAFERGHQVKLMARIYIRAKSVLVWLGPDPERRAKAIFSMARNPSQTSTREGYQALKESTRVILRCEYFTRLWVVQEVHLAESALSLWGEEETHYDFLKQPLEYVSQSLMCGITPWTRLTCRNKKIPMIPSKF